MVVVSRRSGILEWVCGVLTMCEVKVSILFPPRGLSAPSGEFLEL